MPRSRVPSAEDNGSGHRRAAPAGVAGAVADYLFDSGDQNPEGRMGRVVLAAQ
jgi:hypothetical protein